MESESSAIKNFLENSSILITGSTGFLGKLMVEKLLRVTATTRLYLLVRCKKGKDEKDRFDEMFEQPIFNDLKIRVPDFKSRVTLIAGDCVLPNLGICEDDQNVLINCIELIFHCAATVRFDQKLKTAAYINVRATRDIIAIAKKMDNLKGFVHVSTAYSNCPRVDIDERFYKPRLSPDDILNLIDILDDAQLEACTNALLEDWPNTYVYTKCISEDLLRTEAVGLPAVLVRPSMIISTYKEPLEGWIDNFYGPVGVSCAVALGLIRTLWIKSEYEADMVPADYVVNVILSAAWEASEERYTPSNQDVKIYNFVSSPEAPINWKTYMKYFFEYGVQISSTKTIWTPILHFNRYKWKHDIEVVIMHLIPAYIVDCAAFCLGKKPKLVNGYVKIHKFIDILSYFTTRQWKFSNNNTVALWDKLSPVDKELFEFSMGQFDWKKFFPGYIKGTRVYLVKDPMETVPAGRRKYYLLLTCHYTLMAVLLTLFLYMMSKLFFW